jgi:nicotinamidase-related amidase
MCRMIFSLTLKTKRLINIVEPLQRLVVAAHRNDVPIIYSIDAHYPQDIEVVRKWGNHAIKGTKGAEVILELKPEKTKDYIIEKRTYSGFYETDLDPLLRSLYKGESVKTVIIGGLHTNICIRHTSADAFFRGYQIVIAKDAVSQWRTRSKD